MSTYFFTATKSAHTQITRLFDFVWPTAAAMWNLRWQVTDFLNVMPGATVEQLQARFVEGTDINGANLRRACIDNSWDKQKEEFARIILTNTIAIYEGWIDEVLCSLGKKTKQLKDGLQFSSSRADTNVFFSINAITAVESIPLRNAFYDTLCRNRYYSFKKLNEILICYRFFKELRNCDMHGGGVADNKLIDAYNCFLAIATPARLGVKEVPVHTPPIINNPISLDLRGVVGFSHIVLKIITTLDAEFCRSKNAEKPFIKKWKNKHPRPKTFSADATLRKIKIEAMAASAEFPKPLVTKNFGDWLNSSGLTLF